MLRAAAGRGLDELLQLPKKLGVLVFELLAPAARSAAASLGELWGTTCLGRFEFLQPSTDRTWGQSGGARRRGPSAVARRLRLGSNEQTPGSLGQRVLDGFIPFFDSGLDLFAF